MGRITSVENLLRGLAPSEIKFAYVPNRGPLLANEKVEILRGELLPGLKLSNNSHHILSGKREFDHVEVGKAEAGVSGGIGKGISVVDNAMAFTHIVALDKAILQSEKIGDVESVELYRLSQKGLSWKVASFAVTYFIWIALLFAAPQVVIAVATFVSLVFFLRALYFFVQPTLKELQMTKDFHKEVVNTQSALSNDGLNTQQKAERAKEMIDQLLGKELPGKKSILKIPAGSEIQNRFQIYETHLNRRISVEGAYYIYNNKTRLEELSKVLEKGSDSEKLEAIALTKTFLEKTAEQIEVKQTEISVKLYVIYGLIFVGLILSIASIFVPGTEQFVSQRFAMAVTTNSVFVTMHFISILTGYKTKAKAALYDMDQNSDLGTIDGFDGDLGNLDFDIGVLGD